VALHNQGTLEAALRARTLPFLCMVALECIGSVGTPCVLSVGDV
jgi:hypothetical protein